MSQTKITSRDHTRFGLAGVAGFITTSGALAGQEDASAPRGRAMSGTVRGLEDSKSRRYTVPDADLDQVPVHEFFLFRSARFEAVNTRIDESAVQVNIEDCLPGPDILWSKCHDPVQYVTSGCAEITFHLPPLMQEAGSVVAGPVRSTCCHGAPGSAGECRAESRSATAESGAVLVGLGSHDAFKFCLRERDDEEVRTLAP